MMDIEGITWPDEALEPAAIGDALVDETLEIVTSPGTTTAANATGAEAIEFWHHGPGDPWRLCGTDRPGAVTFSAEFWLKHDVWDHVYHDAGYDHDGVVITGLRVPFDGDPLTPYAAQEDAE